MNMKYFNLKIGKGNYLAEDWLNGRNPINLPAAVIFFGKCTIEEIREGKEDPQTLDFYLSSLPENRENTIITVVWRGKGWIIKPAGALLEIDPLKDVPNYSGIQDKDLWKVMPVEVIKSFWVKDVPHILAGINSNAYLGRGTYREIKYWGNIKSIHHVLGLPFPPDHLEEVNCTPLHLLECLSSVELETLIAKLLEAAGCFVPAYRGGSIPDIDLFAYNNGKQEIRLGEMKIPAMDRISIQVKGLKRIKTKPQKVDYLVGLNAEKSENVFNASWLYDQVKQYPSVYGWLKKSLSWLPSEFMEEY
jgi:hypothetical protein